MKKGNILIIAPHPDDEVLGCGGIIKKYSRAGFSVFVLVITRGTPLLYNNAMIENVRKEAIQAYGVLGVTDYKFLDFFSLELDNSIQAKISNEIQSYIKINSIDTLYVPHKGDIHQDHRVVFNAALVAGRPINGSSVKSIYAYEALSGTEWASPYGGDTFIPTRFVDITDELLYKCEAMACFKSQLKPFPNTRSLETIEALAKFRGSTVGFERAEAFMVIRQIED